MKRKFIARPSSYVRGGTVSRRRNKISCSTGDVEYPLAFVPVSDVKGRDLTNRLCDIVGKVKGVDCRNAKLRAGKYYITVVCTPAKLHEVKVLIENCGFFKSWADSVTGSSCIRCSESTVNLPAPYNKYYDVTEVIGPGDGISEAFKNYPQFTVLGEAELKEKYEPIFDDMNRGEYWGLWIVHDESDNQIKLAFSYSDRVLDIDADEIVGIVDGWKDQQIDKVLQDDGDAVEEFAEFCGLDVDDIFELDGDDFAKKIDEYAAFLDREY